MLLFVVSLLLFVNIIMPERTYLRIRRRRNAVSALKIQLDGIDNYDESTTTSSNNCLPLSEQEHHRPLASTVDGASSSSSKLSDPLPPITSPPTKRSKIVVWRRVSGNNGQQPEAILLASSRKRDYRVVDAVLDDDDIFGNTTQPAGELAHKRRRLTLVEPVDELIHGTGSTTQIGSNARKKPAYKILPPTERLVDDSLQQVFAGTRAVSEHFELCSLDPRLFHDSRQWFAWTNPEYGNLLHACALWNDEGVAQELLNRDLVQLLQELDGEGRKPHHVAELCGHSHLADLLRGAFEEEDYVFDLYCMDGETMSDDVDTSGATETETPLDCELQGGVGYWDENGQLVLNLIHRTMSEVSVADEDELDDPNHEDWNGNDYPEDDFEDDLSNIEDPDEFHLYRDSHRSLYGELGIGDEGDFDAAYGIYGQNEPEYDYEA